MPLIPQDFQILEFAERTEARCDFLPHKICFTDLGPKQLEPMLSRNVWQLFRAGVVGRAGRNDFSLQTV